MKYIALRTDDGKNTGKIAMYCRVLKVSRQAFYQYLRHKDMPWKYQWVVDLMNEIISEDECNDTYGRKRMYQALKIKVPNNPKLPCENTIRKIMEKIGLIHKHRRKPNGITKADKEARKSDDLIKRNFRAAKPLEKGVTDITEIPAKDGKLYVSALFDCFDAAVLGLSMADNMRAELCVQTLNNACLSYPGLRGAIVHSDRGSQYTSEKYRLAVSKCGIRQSMNSAGGRCHDNARCESLWARMKEELFYSRNRKSQNYTIEQLRSMIWRYFMSYWNNRRIFSSNAGLPPMLKRKLFYSTLPTAA